jgi:hypothetical protein
MSSIDATQSIPALSTATTTVPVILDNGQARGVHTAVCTAAASTTGGVITLYVSQDGTNWFGTAMTTLSAAGVTVTTVTGAYRFVKAAITTTVTGGTVGVTVFSAE